MTARIAHALVLVLSLSLAVPVNAEAPPDGWESHAPDAGIPPKFEYREGVFTIHAEKNSGLFGQWQRHLPVNGGRWYRFAARYRATDVEQPARHIIAKLTWTDGEGNLVPRDPALVMNEEDLNQAGDVARPLYPPDIGTDREGRVMVEKRYKAPDAATALRVELQFRGSPGGWVEWSHIELEESEAPRDRIVRLAAVHFAPPGKSAPDNCRAFDPLVKEAAEKKADLVVLGEHVTVFGFNYDYTKVAEPIPGPSTEIFAEMAKRHNVYIVVGLIEKDADRMYNTAVLLGPEEGLIGKYRKVCPTDGEMEQGILQGTAYPAFPTRFGKVGMMICWDVHFPEVARNLRNHGAEVIAMPIAGGMPVLAAARAMENQVFLVTSTYTDHEASWMKSGVWSPQGKLLCQANAWGTVVVSEVNLDEIGHWWGIGDFRGRIDREKPAGFGSIDSK